LRSHLDEATIWYERARNAASEHPLFRALLASAYGLTGDIERAAAELTEARALARDDRYTSIAQLRAGENWGVPDVRSLAEATYFTGLRKAGLPEE
jgi:ATP/maltotriose-dependent transcriptional regulator MalT